MFGLQYPSDTGLIDILPISKDVVVELERGRASDSVVGQIQRYIGYLRYELCESNQAVIIALEDDLRLRRALAWLRTLSFSVIR